MGYARQGISQATDTKQPHARRSAEEVERQIRRFPPRLQPDLERFGGMSARYADLLFTFPAACIAVVTGHGSPWSQQEALQLVRGGAPLGDVAWALGVPAWLRRLPPEAFEAALPPGLGAWVSDGEFARRILNTLPQDAKQAACWLRWVLAARNAGDDDFTIWIAAHSASVCRPRLPIACLLPLAVFAWFSRHPQLEASKLMRGAWTPKTSIGRAASLTRQWLYGVLLELCLEASASACDWRQLSHVAGFTFVPLLTSASLLEESVHMRNCVATYGASVVWGSCRLYSVRHNGARVANLEIRAVRGRPEIAQLLGPGNASVSKEVHRAAQTWLELRSQGLGEAGSFRCAKPTDAAFRRHVWEPYCSAVRAEGRHPPSPSSVPALLNAVGVLRSLEKS